MPAQAAIKIFTMPPEFPCGEDSSCCGPIGQTENENEPSQTTDVRKGAREFAHTIRNSPKIRTFIEVQQEMNGDSEAQDIIKRFQTMQQLSASGAMDIQDCNEIMEVQKKLQNNPLIRDFIEALEAAAEFLQEVNTTITGILGVDCARHE